MSSEDDSEFVEDADGESAESAESGSRVVRGRELARLLRRQAYQRAKEARAKDPKYLAMKQLAKERRREAGKAAREKRKAEQAVERVAEKKESTARRAGERAERDQKLRELLLRGGAPSEKPAAVTAAAPPSTVDGESDEACAAALLRVRAPRSEYDVN